MSRTMGNYAQAVTNGLSSKPSLTSLKRWSCSDQALPPVHQIKTIHVYDVGSQFDHETQIASRPFSSYAV